MTVQPLMDEGKETFVRAQPISASARAWLARMATYYLTRMTKAVRAGRSDLEVRYHARHGIAAAAELLRAPRRGPR